MLRPYGSKLLVALSKEATQASEGFLLADTIKAKLPTTQGKVLAIGKRVERTRVGTTVVFSFGIGHPVVNGEQLILEEEQVLLRIA